MMASFPTPFTCDVAAGRNRRDHRDLLAFRKVDLLRLVVLDRAIRLHRAAEVRAAVRDDREARLAVQLTVVADVRGAVRHLAGLRVHEELRHEPLAFREVLQRAQVDFRVPLSLERGDDHEADGGHGHETADQTAQPERRALEEPIAREALAGLDLGRCRLARIGRAGFACAAALRLDRGDRLASKLLRRCAGPEEAADDRDHDADRHDHLRVDDQPDEDAGDPRREPDRIERRARGMRPVPVLGFRHRASPLWVTTSGFNPRPVPCVNDVSIGATKPEKCSAFSGCMS